MQGYTAKDPKISAAVQQLHANYGEIDNIKMNYLLGGGPADAGSFTEAPTGMPRNRPTVALDPDEEKSLLSGFKDLFSRGKTESMSAKGLGGRRPELTPQQWDTIRYKLDNIDMLLKKECLFCGMILIDMIDNDIEDSASKLYEFAPA